MKPTHKFTNDYGHTYYGVVIARRNYANWLWFLCLCNDRKTWMKEPVCVIEDTVKRIEATDSILRLG